MESGSFVTGPGGRRLLIGGSQAGTYLWDPAVLAGPNYPNQVGKNNYGGAREYVTADFDGDGVDEVVNLNFDDTGHDLMAQSLGGRYQVSNNALTQVTVNTLT